MTTETKDRYLPNRRIMYEIDNESGRIKVVGDSIGSLTGEKFDSIESLEKVLKYTPRSSE